MTKKEQQKKQPQKDKHLHARLSGEDYERLRKYAYENHLNMSKAARRLLNEAIGRYDDKEEGKIST